MISAIADDAALHNGWSKDHFALAAGRRRRSARTPTCSSRRCSRAAPARAATPGLAAAAPAPRAGARDAGGAITVSGLAARAARRARRAASLPRRARRSAGRASDWAFAGPLDYLGQDGGAGLGSGPGMAVGAALALRGQRPDRGRACSATATS